jgi:hemerythrin superfamily protein
MPTSAATRVSDRVKHDHQELQTYYNNIKKAQRDDEKIKWQNQFVWELARHSVAEELVVYPAFEKHIPGGPRMAEKDRSEHQQVRFLPPSFSLPISQPMQQYFVLTV